MFASIVAAVVEGWQELRIHKVRVLLSLVGVAVSIAALTSAMGLGVMADQMVRETYERMSGRPATYTLSLASEGSDGFKNADARRAVEEVLARHEVRYASISTQPLFLTDERSPNGEVIGEIVDPDYAQMHAVGVASGRWFVPGDEANLSPPIVANQEMLDMLGVEAADLPLSTTLPAEGDPMVTIIGVAAVESAPGVPGFYVMPQNAAVIDAQAVADQGYYDLEVWLPEGIDAELADQIASGIRQELPALTVDVYRSDAFAEGGVEELDYVQYAMVGAAAVILLLAVLSLVNINVVTIQQQVREIGIRRSFGATGGRIFFSVVMESVVATALAGVVGVMIAIAVLKSPVVTEWMLDLVVVSPPFPLGVAVLGVLVSVLTGVLAGMIPAVVVGLLSRRGR